MKVCIRCNPVSELQETPEGLRCRLHGDQYVFEEQPDAVPEPVVAEEAPADPQQAADTDVTIVHA